MAFLSIQGHVPFTAFTTVILLIGVTPKRARNLVAHPVDDFGELKKLTLINPKKICKNYDGDSLHSDSFKFICSVKRSNLSFTLVWR